MRWLLVLGVRRARWSEVRYLKVQMLSEGVEQLSKGWFLVVVVSQVVALLVAPLEFPKVSEC